MKNVLQLCMSAGIAAFLTGSAGVGCSAAPAPAEKTTPAGTAAQPLITEFLKAQNLWP